MGNGLLLWWTYASPFAYVYDLRSHTIDSFDRKSGNFDPPMYISGRMVAGVSSPEPKLHNHLLGFSFRDGVDHKFRDANHR